MIKLENLVTPSNEQWLTAIRGMRNPMNSWKKSDTKIIDGELIIGENDLDLMQRLIHGGTEHRKFLRMLPVVLDITAPLFWWKEADTYKVGTTANSCSTMHKIHSKPFDLGDFSYEHLFISELDEKELDYLNRIVREKDFCVHFHTPYEDLYYTIEKLNIYREAYIRTKEKKYWWQMIETLPSSYNQRRTVMLNYEVLFNMFHQRKNHKLDDWRTFCDFIKTEIPYSKQLIIDYYND